jgi:hypothetical protein
MSKTIVAPTAHLPPPVPLHDVNMVTPVLSLDRRPAWRSTCNLYSNHHRSVPISDCYPRGSGRKSAYQPLRGDRDHAGRIDIVDIPVGPGQANYCPVFKPRENVELLGIADCVRN